MAPRSIASGVALNFGLISTSVTLFAALEARSSGTGNVLVCDGAGQHEARQISQPRMCGECGEVPYQQLKKARKVEGGLVVLDADDLTALGAEAERHKRKAAVTAHPSSQVELLTSSGEKMYYLVPERGHEATYTTLMALVERHPDLAFVTQWTPRSAVSQFRLRVHEGALVFQERVSAGRIRPAPDVALDENAELIGLAEQVLAMPGLVSDYDPETYADTSGELLAQILAGKEVIPTGEPTAPAAANVSDLMERLRAQVAAESKPTRRKKKGVA